MNTPSFCKQNDGSAAGVGSAAYGVRAPAELPIFGPSQKAELFWR
jgi:hypothetical protein